VTVVVLSYPNGAQEEVLLVGVPRVGDHIRRRHANLESNALVVDSVVWIEGGNGSPEPSVLVTVHTHD
jgi:hypothetical protein